jgi:hypothetical protein
MITMIKISGINCTIMLLPSLAPPPKIWANAGVMNIAPPQAGPGAPALGKKGRFCAEIGADYSGHWPNCNVARPLLQGAG